MLLLSGPIKRRLLVNGHDQFFMKKNGNVFICRENLFLTLDPRKWYRVLQSFLCCSNTDEKSPVTEGVDVETALSGSGC